MNIENTMLAVDAIVDAGCAWPSQGDAEAYTAGYTHRVNIEGGCQGGEFLVKPDEDLDDRFRAWGVDWQEWSWVNGSNCLIEGVN